MAGSPAHFKKSPLRLLGCRGPGQLRRRKNLQLRAQVGVGHGLRLTGPRLCPAKEAAYIE